MPREATLREKLDKATLERLYTHAGLSSVEIAERFGTQPSRVRTLMVEYDIPRRPRGTRVFLAGEAAQPLGGNRAAAGDEPAD